MPSTTCSTPHPLMAGIVMLLSGIGILINGFTTWLFRRGQQGDVNVRGAYLHSSPMPWYRRVWWWVVGPCSGRVGCGWMR